jgi:hypothetical protein
MHLSVKEALRSWCAPLARRAVEHGLAGQHSVTTLGAEFDMAIPCQWMSEHWGSGWADEVQHALRNENQDALW